jgi:flavodoxin
MKVLVVYDSMTGNTERAAEYIGGAARDAGHEVTVRPVGAFDLKELATADIVFVGCWTDGLFFFGQRPGRSGRFRKMPVITGKRVAAFCTYAINSGKTVDSLADILSDLGADVVATAKIHRKRIAEEAKAFAAEALGAVPVA